MRALMRRHPKPPPWTPPLADDNGRRRGCSQDELVRVARVDDADAGGAKYLLADGDRLAGVHATPSRLARTQTGNAGARAPRTLQRRPSARAGRRATRPGRPPQDGGAREHERAQQRRAHDGGELLDRQRTLDHLDRRLLLDAQARKCALGTPTSDAGCAVSTCSSSTLCGRRAHAVSQSGSSVVKKSTYRSLW